MAKIVTDYTALEILKHAAKQELYDFHKVYVQTEPATEKTTPQWDEQYLCIGFKEIFLIKCRVLNKERNKGGDTVKAPQAGGGADDSADNDGRREAEADSDSEENADHMPPVVIFRFPYIAIQSIIVPTKDDFGFVINLASEAELLELAKKYQLYSDKRAYLSLLPDDHKEEDPDDEKIDLANPAERRKRDQGREGKRIGKVQTILDKEWRKLPAQITILTLLRLPVIQSLRATYKTDSVMRENKMSDVLMIDDPALRVSPFKRFQHEKEMLRLKAAWTEARREPRLIDKLHTESCRSFFRANYSFMTWQAFTDTTDFDTERLYSSYTLPVMDEEQLKEYNAKKVRPPGFGKDDYIPLAALKPNEKELRRQEWSRELIVKMFPYQLQFEPDINAPKAGSSDLIFASSIEYMATAIASDQCAKSYRDALLKAERLKIPSGRVKCDERFFVVAKEMYTKEVSITNDRSKYFCYKVHIVTADRQIGLMGVRRKFMPPDAARMQDLVFVLVGRKLKFFTKKEIDESDGVLKDEQFDPEEMQEFMVPLERIVDSLVPLETHPEASATVEAYSAYKRVQNDIAAYPMQVAARRAEADLLKKKLDKEESSLRALKKQVDGFELAETKSMTTAELTKHTEDLKKANGEFMRLVTKAREIEKEYSAKMNEIENLNAARDEKYSEFYEQTDKALEAALGLQFAWAPTEIYAQWVESELKREEKIKKKQEVQAQKPWWSKPKDTLQRRKFEPLQVTAYDANMINARLNALLFDSAGFAWCRENGYVPNRKLKAIKKDKVALDLEEEAVRKFELEDNNNVPLPDEPVNPDEVQYFDDDTQSDNDLRDIPGESAIKRSERLEEERNAQPQIAAKRLKKKLKARKERRLLRTMVEKLIDPVPRRSLHEWAQRFCKAAMNCIRPNVTDKMDMMTKEKTSLSGKYIWKVEERDMTMWSPAEEWAKCMLALEQTYGLDSSPEELQTWKQRLAIYLTDVLTKGWELEDPTKPPGTRVTLHDLLTKPVPHTQSLDDYQKSHSAKVGLTLELRKDQLRETVLELLLQPSVRPFRTPKTDEKDPDTMYQHGWWWTPERQAPFLKGYEYTGSVYIKLLELWAISNKMIALEAQERELKGGGERAPDIVDDEDAKEDVMAGEGDGALGADGRPKGPVPQKPEFPPYPNYNLNETLVQKLLDTNYIRWDVMLQDIAAWKKTPSALPFIPELLEVQPDVVVSDATKRMLDEKPWTRHKFERQLQTDEKQKMFQVMARKFDDEGKFDIKLEGDEKNVWLRSHIDIQLADLPVAIAERGKIIPPFLASLLTDRNYNHSLVLSVCNWICRTAKFAVPDDSPPEYDSSGNMLERPRRPYFEMNMRVVALALMKLTRTAGPVLVAAAYRALTAIAADKEQTFMIDVFQSEARGFLLDTMKYISLPNTNSLIIAAAANFSSILVGAGEEYYQFFIQLNERDESIIDYVLPALNRLLLPVMHGERHEGKLLTAACRFAKRLAGNSNIRNKMWLAGFVGSMAELLFQWDKFFNTMEQCVGALTNLMYCLPVDTLVQIMPPRWDQPPNMVLLDTAEEDENAEVAGQVFEEALKQIKGMMSSGGDGDDKAAREAAAKEAAAKRQEQKAKKRADDEALRLKRKKEAAERDKLEGAQVRPADLKRVLKGICLLLSRSAARIHRENGLLALRNATFREPTQEEIDRPDKAPFAMNPVMAFLMRECELETILSQLYSGYANVEDTENEPEFREAEAVVMNRKAAKGAAGVQPPSKTRAREMDLIRLLLGRIKEFKDKWQEIKEQPWVL